MPTSVLAHIQLPMWSPAVAFLVICWAIDLASTRRKRRAGEARRLRALDKLWDDGVTEPGRENVYPGSANQLPELPGSVTSFAVSPRPAATDAGGFGDAA